MAKKRFSKALTSVSKSLNKKGRIKGKNKKETKALKGACPHHKINRKGRVKPTVYVQDKDCICELCGKRFPAKFFSNEKVDEIVDDFEEFNNQAKYLATAVNQNSEICDFFSEVGVRIVGIKKKYKKVRNVAKKQSDIKKRKKKNRYQGSSQYGSWGSNK